MSDEKNTVEYKGPGKLNAALGRAATEGIVTATVSGVVGGVIGAFTRLGYKRGMAAGFVAGELIGNAHGAYKGVGDVNAEKEQLNAVATELSVAKEALSTQKSFTEAYLQERAAAASPANKRAGPG